MENNIFDYSKTEVYLSMINTIENTKGSYKGIDITESYVNFRHWGRKSQTIYVIDLIFPINTYDNLVQYYCPDGFGYPQFNNLNDVIIFIDNLITSNNELLKKHSV